MNYEPAFQAYIDGKIPREHQPSHSVDIGKMHGAWQASLRSVRHRLGRDDLPTAAELIRFENKIKGLWEDGELPCLIHLCGGNEAELIEIFAERHRPGDWVFSGHRSHYHYLLAGGSEERLESQIRSGSSMFIFDRELNFFTSSILAGTCGIAAGVAWQLREEHVRFGRSGRMPQVLCFLGDGAEDEGHFYEAVCFVQGQNLPCTFIIEDNDRSVETSISERGRHRIPWPSCVIRYHYRPTYPHAGSGCKHHITFDPNFRPTSGACRSE